MSHQASLCKAHERYMALDERANCYASLFQYWWGKSNEADTKYVYCLGKVGEYGISW
jgi:hypothetical protein